MTIKYVNPIAPVLIFGRENAFSMGKSEFFNTMSDTSLEFKPEERITRVALRNMYGDNGATDHRRFKWYQRDALRHYNLGGGVPGRVPPMPDDVNNFIAPLFRGMLISQPNGEGKAVTLSITAANHTRIQWYTSSSDRGKRVPIEGATTESLVLSADQVTSSFGPIIGVTLYNDNRKTFTEVPPVRGNGKTYESTVR